MKQILFILLLATSLIQVHAQCSGIDFNASKTIGCKNELIRFYAQGVPAGSNYRWFVSGKEEAGMDTFYHFFNKTGNFDIKMEVTLPDNSVCTVDKTGYIRITSPQIDSVVSDKPILCDLNEQVTLTGYGAGIKQWNWSVENNYYTDVGNTISYTFTTEGVKKVKLVVIDSNGCLSQYIEDSVVHITGVMTVNFLDSNTSGCQPLQVVFKPDVTVNKPGNLSYYWRFPGGIPVSDSSEIPDTVLYKKPGSHDVSLKVTMANGCQKILTKAGWVKVGDTAHISIISDQVDICKQDVVKFYNLDSVSSPSNLVWSFPGGVLLPNSTQDTQFVLYPSSGKYNVALTYNYNGCSASETKTNYIDVLNMKANYSILNPYNCTPPHAVSFQSTSTLPGTGNVWFEWTFYKNDGQHILATNNLPNPSYSYNNYGRYKVTLKLTHSPRGCVDSIQKLNAVIVQPFIAELNNMGQVKACVDQSVYFAIPNSILSYSLYPIDIDWTFYELDPANIKLKTTGKNTTVPYDTGGLYNYKVVVNNHHGCNDSVYFTKKIEIVEILSNFSQDTSLICNNSQVVFSEDAYPSSTYNSYWNFTNLSYSSGNFSKTSASVNVPATFTYPGVYSTRLVSAKGSCSDTSQKDSNVFVSGIYGDINVQTATLCPGDSSLVSAIVTLDENYSGNPDSVQYYWEVDPSSGFSISDPAAKSTYITFYNDGCYSIRLYLTNGAGCSYQVFKTTAVCVGTKAQFSFPSEICPESEVQIGNNSLRGLSFNWAASDTAVHFIPNNGVAAPKVMASHPGDFQIKLTSSSSSCLDSVSANFRAQYVTADFFTNDTLNFCAPSKVTLFAASSDANYYQWYFDEVKISTSDTQVSYYYLKNSGSADTGYAVKLIATTSAGCTDTFVRVDYIQVVGPVSKFTVLDHSGCTPFSARFEDKSTNISSYLFQFDDGYFVENKSFASHIYDISNSTGDSVIFVPRLFAFDNSGCNFLYEGDSISVYQNARAGFTVDKEIGCSPLEVTFLNTSQYAGQNFWDFENDGLIDDSTEYPFHTYTEGLYTVKLVTTNRHQCNDTIIKKDFIDVYAHLKGGILTTDTVVCLTSQAVFYPEIILSKMNIAKYAWKFFDNNASSDTSSLVNGRHFYSATGYYDLQLILTDDFGCKDTVFRTNYVYVADTVKPVGIDINYATVVNNAGIHINWDSYFQPDFKTYQLFRSAGAGNALIYQSYNAADTAYTDNNGNPQVDFYRYQVQVENFCLLNSKPSPRHNNILLSASSPSHGLVDFEWSAYNGWPSVTTYDVYRKNPGDTTFNLLTSLPGSDTTWTDSYLCNQNYCYYILAKDTGSFVSQSNTVCLTPVYNLPSLTFARRTTLVNNSLPLTEWVDQDATRKSLFIVDRKKSNESWFADYAFVQDTFFYDSLAGTIHDYYAYRVRSIDSCGNANNNPTQATNTILLDVNITDNDQILLEWNPYPEILPGKLSYILEMQDVDSVFKPITTLSSGTIQYTDNQVYKESNRAFCYRIKADFDNDTAYQSISNIACVLFPSRVYLPTAFSPNGDGLNDYFTVASTSLFEMTGDENLDFTMSIFNQWGEILFSTDDPNGYWDGTFKGDYVPGGIYYYQIYARGMDDKTYHLSGSISVLR